MSRDDHSTTLNDTNYLKHDIVVYESNNEINTATGLTIVECGPANGQSAAKTIDYCNLESQQALVVVSLILITYVIIGIIHSLIITKTRDQIINQWKDKIGKICLLSLFIALITFYINSITMTYFVFNLDNITEGQRPWLLCFGKIPYQTGRLIIEFFFIIRLHVIFGTSAKSVQNWVLISLMILSSIEFILGCIASMGSPFVFNWFNWDPKVHTGIRLVIITLFMSFLLIYNKHIRQYIYT